MSMRIPTTELDYDLAIKRGDLNLLFDEPAKRDFKYWKIVKNRFPHDKIAEVNDMLVLKRKSTLRGIKLLEFIELIKIVQAITPFYDTVHFNLPNMSSVKDIPHLQLYKLKPEYQ